MKALTEMTLAELWALFPIVLRPYDQQWKKWAEEEMASLVGLLGAVRPLISHVGSTAIGGIMAKPIVDILVEVPIEISCDKIRILMEQAGYICMAASERRMSFNKGYTVTGYAEKVYHVHLRRYGDNDEILFRDYLIARPELAKEYEALKMSLLPEYSHNRDGYTEAKSDFVRRIMAAAKKDLKKD